MDRPSGPGSRRRFLASGATALGVGVAGCLGSAGPDVTESGSAGFDVPEGVVSVENRNGDVEVGVAPALDASILATAGNSDIDVEVESTARTSHPDRFGVVSATVGRCTLTSANGDVRLYELGA